LPGPQDPAPLQVPGKLKSVMPKLGCKMIKIRFNITK
jgi:hypothetical protein